MKYKRKRTILPKLQRPTPHGVGGLKWLYHRQSLSATAASHPARGGWIEILKQLVQVKPRVSPTPHGVGGLK